MNIIIFISNTTPYGAIIASILLINAVIVISWKLYNIFDRLIGKYDFNKHIDIFCEYFKIMEDDYERMFCPDHLTTDDEIRDFKNKYDYNNLYEDIENLHNHKYYDCNAFVMAGCTHFLHYKQSMIYDKEHNNRLYKSICDLERKCSQLMKTWKWCMNEKHYFTQEEFDTIRDAMEKMSIKQHFDLVFPKYKDYVKSTDCLLLYELVKLNRMEKAREEHNLMFSSIKTGE